MIDSFGPDLDLAFSPGRRKSVKTIHLSSDCFSLNNNIILFFCWSNNSFVKFFLLENNYSSFHKSIPPSHICNILSNSFKIRISFFFLWLIKFL